MDTHRKAAKVRILNNINPEPAKNVYKTNFQNAINAQTRHSYAMKTLDDAYVRCLVKALIVNNAIRIRGDGNTGKDVL